MPVIVTLVAKSGAGKTTFLERLIPELRARDVRVAIVKPDARRFEMDQPGKDTYRLREAGAAIVAIASARQVALIEQVVEPWTVEALIGLLGDRVDLVICESRKPNPYPKIELVRGDDDPRLRANPDELIAIISDRRFDVAVPHFALDDAPGVAAFLLAWMGME